MKENSAGLGVYNNYGPRGTAEGRIGDINTGGIVHEQEYDVSGDGNAATLTGWLREGATILDVNVDVSEAFVGITGIDIGTKGSEATNGITVPVGAVGFSQVTPVGTWAATLAADTEVGAAVAGSADGVGRAKVVVRYTALSGKRPV